MSARVHVREAELLAIARALVTPDAYSQVSASLATPTTVTKIGPTAMGLLEDTLAKGIVKTLARLGGARRRIRPDTSSTKAARVFEVRATPKIAFGPYTFELLAWLAGSALAAKTVEPLFTGTPRTLGDELCAYLALRLVEGQRAERALGASPGLQTPLTALGFVRTFARHETAVTPTFESLLATVEGRTVVECLELDLARRWISGASWDETDVLDAEHAVRIVNAERAVLDAWLDAIDRAGRWDLAGFLVDAGARVLAPGLDARDIALRAAPPVTKTGTLRARTESRQRAGALFRALGRVQAKRDDLALVRFIDDDYDLAQATLSAWEILGRDAFARAENVVTALGALET